MVIADRKPAIWRLVLGLMLVSLLTGLPLPAQVAQVQAAITHTYACKFFHVSITVPSGWAPDPTFSSQNTICTDLQSYTSPEYTDSHHDASFVLNNEEGSNASSMRAAILVEAGNFGLTTPPGSFKTLKTKTLNLLTSTVKSVTSLSAVEETWLFGAACQKYYCVTFVGFSQAGASKNASRALQTALRSIRFTSGAVAAFAPPPKPTPVPAKKIRSVTDPETGVTVTESKFTIDPGDGFVAPKAGHEFWAVFVTLLNNGNQPTSFNEFDFHLEGDTDHVRYLADALDTNISDTLNSGTLNPGDTVAGYLVFEVASLNKGGYLTWQPNPFGTLYTVPPN